MPLSAAEQLVLDTAHAYRLAVQKVEDLQSEKDKYQAEIQRLNPLIQTARDDRDVAKAAMKSAAAAL